MNKVSLDNKVIDYTRTAPDFYGSGISSLNMYNVGLIGKLAIDAAEWNAIELQLDYNLENYEYEPNELVEDLQQDDSLKKIPGMGASYSFALGVGKAFTDLFNPSEKYTNEKGEKSSYAELAFNINVRDALAINITSRLDDLRKTEGKWLPELDIAKQYLELKKTLSMLSPETEGYTKLADEVQSLEDQVKEFAKTNPYIRDIFYGEVVEPAFTHPGLIYPRKVSKDVINTALENNTNQYLMNLSWNLTNNELENKLTSIAKFDNKLYRLQLNLQEATEEFNSKDLDLKNKISALKTKHMLYDPVFGIIPTGLTYNPDIIDPIFDQLRSTNDISIFDPSTYKYGLTHLGSSYSELQTMGATWLIGKAAKYGVKLAGSNFGPLAPLIWAGSEAVFNALQTNYFRNKETAAEVMSNYAQKVIEGYNNNSLPYDLKTVMEEFDTGLRARGYKTELLDDLEKLQLALAYNIKSSDENYNKFAEASRVGLTEIELKNNALALMDYAQNFGLSYGGALVKEAVANEITREAMYLLKRRSKVRQALRVVDNKIEKVADKVFSNPMQRVATKRALKSIGSFAAATGVRYASEAVEEGQQRIYGIDYLERPEGLKENSYSIISGAFQAGDAAIDAVLAYNGLHWNDLYNTDEELKTSMQIGGFIGAFMGGISRVGGARKLKKQLKSDLSLQKLAAEGFDKADRSFKTAQFLDAYRKGVNSSNIRESIEAFKQYRNSEVTDKMIEKDLELADLVYGIYKNKEINSNLKDLNINRKDSKEFELFVLNLVDLINRFEETSEIADKNTNSISELIKLLSSGNLHPDTEKLILEEYLKYLSNKDSKELLITLEEFKAPIINAIVTRATNRVLNRLKKDLSERKKTIEQIKEEYGIKVSTTGIIGILEHIKKRQVEILGILNDIDTKVFNNTLNRVKDPDNIKELEDAITVLIVNLAVLENISTKVNAYKSGRMPISSRYMVEQKPLYSTLTDSEKASVLTEYAKQWKELHKTDQEPTEKQVISFYNHKINTAWNEMEQNSNVESNERTLANAIFREDIRRAKEELQQAKQEIKEDLDIEDEESTTESTVEQQEEETKPTEVKDDDKGSDKKETSEEASVTKDEASDDASRETSNTSVDEVGTSDKKNATDTVEEETNAPVSDIDTMLDDATDLNYIGEEIIEVTESPTDQQEAATHDEVDENALDEDALRAKYDGIKEGEPLADINEVNDTAEEGLTESVSSEELLTEQPTVKELEDEIKEPEVLTPKEDKTKGKVKVTVESYDGSNDMEVEVPVENQENVVYSDGTETWIGNEDPTLGTPIPETDLLMQSEFEMVDAVDMGTTQEAASYLGQTEKSPGLDTKRKVETNRIHSTFFYAYNSTTVMPIEVNGKPMQFDGERRSGYELAKKLAIPGWLAKLKTYYVVTDSKETRKNEKDAADRLAVHLIIEETTEDGKKLIYNTALYQPDKARTKIDKWKVSSTKRNEEINKLRQLRKSIIDKYVTAYCPDYFTNPNAKLPQVAPKGIIPVNLRQSNGSINSIAENKRPVYKPLTAVKEFGLDSNPLIMTAQILDGVIEFGYGKGAFTQYSGDVFSITLLNQSFDNKKTSAQGVGYAGKIYIIPKVENTPSLRTTAPIMLAEKRHFIKGGSKNLVTSYDPNGNAKFGDDGKRIPLSTAELLFRLVTKTLPIANNPEYVDILNILVNHGPGTITVGDNRVEKLSFYVRKTLHYYTNEKGGFLMYAQRTPEGSYMLKYLKIKDANGKVVFTELLAYDVIRQISNNLHWNTDKEAMLQPIPDSIVNAALEYMNKYNTDKYQILNCEDLVFTARDLNIIKKDGKFVHNGETPILMTWMINHEVLKTDVGDTLFRDPFIYADDAAVAETGKVSAKTKEILEPAKEQITTNQLKLQYNWARYAQNNYEVSSKGDKRFSALYAKFKPGTVIDGVDVSGRTIEYVYQYVIKKSRKGQPPSKESKLYNLSLKTKQEREDFSYTEGYLPLWQEWARQNSELIKELRLKSTGKTLTDQFANTRVSLARALSDILNATQSESLAPQEKARKMLQEGKTEITTSDLFGRSTGPKNSSLKEAERVFGKKKDEQKITLDTGIQFIKTSYQNGYRIELIVPNTDDYIIQYYDNNDKPVGQPFIDIAVNNTQFSQYIDEDMSIKSEDILKIIRENFDKANSKPAKDKPLTLEETKAAGLTPRQGYTYVLKTDGSYVALPNSSKALLKLILERKSTDGVFSTERGKGKINIDLAKKWLQETLGIDPDDVLVTNAVMKTASVPNVYGLLQAAFDRIKNEFAPRITLSSESGVGVEYHEAWHYVSLLILNQEQRDLVYSDFIKNNPEYSKLSKQELEEVLAEEFRTYMLNEKGLSLAYRIKKFFKALYNLINIFGGKLINLQGEVFKAIRKGKFKNAQVDLDTLEEFNKAYQGGVTFYAPGISDKEQLKISHITNANTMYNIIEALSNTALSILDIRSMEDINNLKLDDIFDTIEYMYDSGEYDYDETKKQIVSDVLSNKGIFAKQIRSYLRDLGIREIEREETEIKEKEAKDPGDTYDNIWDRASYEISKKANTAFNAKLFFYSIPKSRFVLDENGNTILDSVKDNIFGLDMAQSFDVTWNKILEKLWNSNDWADLISKVRNEAKADPFFARLLERIDNPAFPLPENTVTQLITTILSAKNSMDTVDIIDTSTGKIAKGTKGRGSRVWNVMDSSNLRKIARLPNLWSLNFMLSSMIMTDKLNRSRINTTAFNKLDGLNKDILKDIKTISSTINSKNAEVKQNAIKQFEQTKHKFLDLVNMIGIPFDMESLNYLLKKILNNKQDSSDFYTFKEIFAGSNQGGKGLSGSISNSIIQNIRTMNINRSLETKFKNNKVSASRIFNYKSPNAVINLMAIAYGEMHPTPEEFSVTGADGSLLYPITLNNYMSDQIRWLNTNAYGKLDNLAKAAYSKNSLIVKALLGSNKPKLKLHTLIAIKDNISNSSRDYFGITPLEDYIAKLVLVHNSRIVLPTMSDKKTWYSIEGINLPKDFLASVRYGANELGVMTASQILRRFSNDTLDIFCDYFLDEYNAVVLYFNTKSDVEKGLSRYYDNYHGKIGKDGKMKPGGNGGRFRYFNKLNINGQEQSLNKMLNDAEKSGDVNLINEALNNIRVGLIENRATLRDSINTLLIDKVNKEIENAIKLGVINRDAKGNLQYGNLPSTSILEDSNKDNPFAEYEQITASMPEELNSIKQNDIVYSIIANYVTGYAISIEELEKCFVGDPAFYKWKSNSEVGIFQRDVDKIKRLSSVLSTGTNLRTYWGENDPRNSTKFVSAILLDNMIGSEYHKRLELIFKADLTRTMLRKNNSNLTDDELFKLTNEKNISNTLKDRSMLSEADVKFIEELAIKSADPYAYDDENNSGNINLADAAVYIRPAFYKRIVQALGEWSPEIEEAFNILEGEPVVDPETGEAKTVLNDPDLYAKALKASIKPLKMMYFGDHFDEISGINVPVFDKMALFPMFKILANADNKYLYDRMNNEKLGTIDMIKFESAVKVGSPANKLKVYKDNKNTQLNLEAINKPSSTVISNNDMITERNVDGLTTRVLDIKQLRLQLNTEPHEHTDRSFGTQAIKICIGNVVDTRTYGGNKGKSVSGELIKRDVFGCIKALSTKGYTKLKSRFFDEKGRLNNKALSNYLIQEARGTNMSDEIIQALKLDKNGNFRVPLSALSSRNWIESKIVSLINKEIIDVNTPGGSAILMSSFGFKGKNVNSYSNISLLNTSIDDLAFSVKTFKLLKAKGINTVKDIIEYGEQRLKWYLSDKSFTEILDFFSHFNIDFNTKEEFKYRSFNDGKKLSFDPDKGSMEVMLSTNFFRDVVPQEFQKDYKTMRDWLIEHKVIGNDSNPYGIGYRIPTQGLSSTFSFIVADVLPAQAGDTIVVPDEFTAMTGSDFDIDKLYIATYSYDPETNERYTWNENAKYYTEQSEGALINKLLDSYTLVISDEKTLAETRASIDTLTGILKKKILPLVQTTELKEAEPMYELMPSFQESRKTEYTFGKVGIAPFALNSTNHCLTQAVHLKMNFSDGAKKYNLNQFDEIDGQDGYKILDWLSAMINAHVDVAKDPYIIVLNVNKVTYNMASFLLRTGKGKSTFLFLAQPALKEFANRKIMNEGVIGVSKAYDNQIFTDIKKKYWDMLDKYPVTQSFKDEMKQLVEEGSIDALNDSKLASSLEAFKTGDIGVMDIIQQLLVIKAYQDLANDSLIMADMVLRSQIDTKKYGNNITHLLNFYNSYTTFMLDNKKKFYINKPELGEGLETYFNKTFLRKKLIYAMDLTNSILRSQIFSATGGYKLLSSAILLEIRGGNYEPTNNGKNYLFLYKSTSNKDYIASINTKIESILRAKAVMSSTQLKLSDEEINELLFGKNSISRRLNSIKNYIRENKDNVELISLVDQDGNVVNELLNYLQAITMTDKKLVNYISTATSSMNNSRYYEDRLRSAFYDLLTSNDPVIKDFAETLVKYAFLTSYDNRTPNSFFNLVPMLYKQLIGYVSAIKDTINKLNYGKSDDNFSRLINSLHLSIVRNYWRDNEIVPVVVRNIKKADDDSEYSTNVINLASGTYKNRHQVNSIISLRGNYDVSKNYKFFKIMRNDGSADVYQRVGDMIDLESGKVVERIYTLVLKLGYDAGSNSIYELYKEGNEQSAFGANVFTEAVNEQITTKLNDIIDKRLNILKRKGQITFAQDEEYTTIESSNYDNIRENALEELTDNSEQVTQTLGDENVEEVTETIEETLTPDNFVDNSLDPSEVDDINHIDDTLLDDVDGIEVEDVLLFEDLSSDNSIEVQMEGLLNEIIETVGSEDTEITEIDEGTMRDLKKKGKQRKKECK